MVLNFIISILLIGGFITSDPCESVIDKKVLKITKEVFGKDRDYSFEFLEETEDKSFFSIITKEKSTSIGTLVYINVRTCKLGGCLQKTKNQIAGTEQFDAIVFVSPQEEIKHVSVLNYFGDYGYEVSTKKYLKQYKGKRACDLRQNTQKVDGISGATISVDALKRAVGSLCSED